MIIIELPQGYYRPGALNGMTRVQAVEMFYRDGEAFLEKFPQCRPYHKSAHVERVVFDTETAPWGHEWYRVVDGVLRFHSHKYDSSG